MYTAIKNLVFTLILVLLLNGCSSEHSSHINGYIEADLVYVSTPSGGKITELYVQRGQPISKGDQIVDIEQPPYSNLYKQSVEQTLQAKKQAQDLETGETRSSVIESAKSEVESAKANEDFYHLYLDRAKDLVKTKSMSQQDFDQVQSNALQANANLSKANNQLVTLTSPARELQIQAAEAEANASKANEAYQKWYLDQTNVTSPRSGHIYDIYIWKGERISNDRPIASILVPDQIKVIFFIPEPLLSKINLNKKISVYMDGQEDPINANISFISDIAEYTPPVIYSQSSRKDLVFRVEAIPEKDKLESLHPGQPINIEL
ncbi:HlyD family efflux transporter periplasmic adaptor subunit [Thiotrichales bacterium 19S9-12]|nr:HlyD family efflux transporter periplasmic adaptor subunit [Thiotrichales bacterium 19S9-11]MCF6812563.1 HlyD family efflux transporter periplasmic adaptor subunit [Thiotrichales bacterium 19S9-12]